MGNIRVKNGTPVGNESLCETCTHALIVKGFRETEELVFCTYAFDQILRMPFKVYKCSGHIDKGMPTWEQMKDMAIEVKPISSTKQAGFYYPEDVSVDVPVESPTMKD
jgi:hypothetical protein